MNIIQSIPIRPAAELLMPGSIPAPVYSDNEKAEAIKSIKKLLTEKDAVLVAHYYVDEEIQKLAEETGGIVSDSLEMARFGHSHSATILVVAGVRFMGETAKILNPEKIVIMPTLKAECSLDLNTPVDAFSEYAAAHSDRTIVVYANTSAAVKARADWVVTSSNAVAIVEHLHAQGEKILWAPDKHLGQYIQQKTDADMLIWDGSCVVHNAFKADALSNLKKHHPDAAILVHPESPQEIIAQADVVGSTSQLIKASQELSNNSFIVATDNGIFYKMQQQAGNKKLIEAPTAGTGASCESCAHCPWMAMNSLQTLEDSLRKLNNEILIDEATRIQALKPLRRMLSFRT